MTVLSFKIVSFCGILLISSQQFIWGQSEKIILNDPAEVQQKDIGDIIDRVFPEHQHKDSASLKGTGPLFIILPAFGYSMHTGFNAAITTSTTFHTDSEKKRISRITLNAHYTQFHQYWFNSQNNIFLEKLKIHLSGDARYYNFPTQTYGLGPNSSSANPLQIDYSYIRLYQVVFREIASNLFVGMGYNLDYHWNIKVDSAKGNELDQFIKFQKGDRSVSSGVSLNIIYDSRKNLINPRKGTFINVQFRPNLTLFGSDNNWQSLLIEFRHYIKLPGSSRNIVAFWSYNDITISGTPPYLDMPSIGWDNYSNTGRGYAPGRYTGMNLLYLESEFRFSLTRNGLLGGIIFVNAESIFESMSDLINSIIPAAGLGFRVKLNKYSDTNLTFDYGFGIKGSHGFFFGIGEVF